MSCMACDVTRVVSVPFGVTGRPGRVVFFFVRDVSFAERGSTGDVLKHWV